jgi:mRNA-degrading endonuclease HigB of HigAB toxin-antitoxin module
MACDILFKKTLKAMIDNSPDFKKDIKAARGVVAESKRWTKTIQMKEIKNHERRY